MRDDFDLEFGDEVRVGLEGRRRKQNNATKRATGAKRFDRKTKAGAHVGGIEENGVAR
jgi:hypothetical protein